MSSEFKPGDRVEVVKDCSEPNGTRGTFTARTNGNGNSHYIDWDNGKSSHCTQDYWSARLKKIGEAGTKFNVGDKVKCISNPRGSNDGFGGGYWDLCKIFVVDYINVDASNSGVPLYRSNNESSLGVYEDHLELVQSIKTNLGGNMKISEVRVTKKSLLKEGFTVKTTKATNGYNKDQLGRIAQIYGGNDSSYPYIKIGSVDDQKKGIGDWIHLNDIVLVQGQLKGLLSTKQKQFDVTHLDKVILPDGHKLAILESLTQEYAENREILFEKWGFGEMFEKGKGIILMFSGVPGTGKTLCAEMIAKYLMKDHITMSTADIQSSVPGQAERNIKKTFEQAKDGKHLVIIDECDSLLYDRNSVGMIMAAEINCLLGEIENFEGVCVLTTNRTHKLDPALERRIALKLEFPKPNAELRMRIWNTLIPKKCPLDKDVSPEKLSKYPVCGGNIKNIIFTAARKALHDKRMKVRMSDFEDAVERELEGSEAFRVGRGRRVSQKEVSTSTEMGVGKGRGKDGKLNIQKEFDV